MVFSSLIFLYAFLPCALLTYFLVPKFLRNAVLLVFSLFFYAWGEPRYLVLILLSIAMGYGAGLAIDRFRGQFLAKLFLTASVVGSLLLLGFFKYTDFLLTTVNDIFAAELPLLRLTLPVGISFYTFQLLSYTVDVYRGTAEAQRNPIDFGAYVVLFPQLIAGPIVRYRDISRELKERVSTLDGIYDGAVRFLVGLGKKVLLANQLGALCAAYRASSAPSVLFAWLNAVAFFLQIYFDFSGYSDMAIGLGRILGFRFMENFDHPYESRSVTEFWRRWHISLGAWFRDYVYIPMGGNRVSRTKWFRNILVVWCLTGLWHGAGWNFLLWGLVFALLLLAEKLWYGEFLKRHRVFSHVYVLAAILLSFVLFNGATMAQVASDLQAMLGLGGIPAIQIESLYQLRSNLILLAVSAVGATSLPLRLWRRLQSGSAVLSVLQPVALVAMLLLCTAFLVDGSFNPFLYFRF